MAKRHHHPEHEEDEIISRASSKRARTDNSDDEEEAPRTRSRGEDIQINGKRDARRRASLEDSDEEGLQGEDEVQIPVFNPDEQISEEEFERLHGDKLRARLDSMRRVQGGVAEHGIIEYIEMHQFMCHKYLKFYFGPQINFIIGHNGSGKSAVLSAITVALGGKAASTGRGNGLKSFIREGQSHSEVTIHIKNQGDEAFKPKEYGNTIVITRKFGRDGGSSWKIKGKDGKVISTKKDELSAICDHMNIQVDNPMNVLTQDAARQFLSASVAQDKYKFFLRGTQLSQLSEEYEICLENIRQTAKLLAVKKAAIPDLKARYRAVYVRYMEAQKARDQKKKADDLKKELAWSHVATKRAEMERAFQGAGKLARRIPKITEELEKAKAQFESADVQAHELDAEARSEEGIEHLSDRKTALQEQLRANRKKLTEFNAELKELNNSMLAFDAQIKGLDDRIAEETRRIAEHTQGKREETQRKLDNAKDAVSGLENEIRDLSVKRKHTGLEADQHKSEDTEWNGKKQTLQSQIAQCDVDINAARQSEKDALVPYGKNIKAVQDKIKSMRWVGDPPIGPLGQHVKAKNPLKWGGILRNQLVTYLCAFAITDARDRPPLKKLLSDSGNQNTTILVYAKDLFDYRSGEPPEQLHTVLRELEISDPYVLRILINQAHIESQVLSDTRKEAEDDLQRLRSQGRGGGSAWSLKGFFSVRVFSEGGASSSPLNIRPLHGSANLLLTGRDSAAEIRHSSELKANLEVQYRALNQQINDRQIRWNSLKQAIDQYNTAERQLQGQLRAAKNHMHNLQNEANEELPVGVQGFEAAKQDIKDEQAVIKAQFKEIHSQKSITDNEQTTLQTQLNVLKDLINEYEERRNQMMEKVNAAIEIRMKAQKDKQYFEKKLGEEQREVDTAEASAKIVEEEFNNWTAKALEYCEEVPNPRKTVEVQRSLDSVQKALKEREKVDGATVEQMAHELNKAEEIYEKAKRDHVQMVRLNKALNNSLIVRVARWQEFRRHIALRCKQVFQYHLSQRGYYGKILFDHVQCTLQIKVQTDDQIQTQGSAEKDPRSLSGGEKSFSTICLLLSLWECIGCPLRCLDEFDVFMDAINRRISMKMMIDTANTSDRKQYILITPQDMSNVSMGPTVKVHRMSDPERGNGTLPFTSA